VATLIYCIYDPWLAIYNCSGGHADEFRAYRLRKSKQNVNSLVEFLQKARDGLKNAIF
jgi:hypothetical protein